MSNRFNHVPSESWMFLSVCAILLFASAFSAHAQESQGAPTLIANASLPSVIRFSGKAGDPSTKPVAGLVGITFALYEQETGGPALWLETQNVQLDATGHYTVLLGTTKPEGLPAEIFFSGQARWIGVQVSGQVEQPRVMLLTVPYAMKAGDAATVGGLPPSAFMLAAPVASGGSKAIDAASAEAAASAIPAATSNVTTSGGAVNTIPLFTTGTNIQNSLLTQTGTTAVNLAGKLNLPASGTATATAGNISRPEDFVTSVFNSTSKAAVAQTFQLQAEPAGNNTAAPSGNLSLLFGSGTAAATETGFKINNKGILTFAAGQTFPGTGKGTITGVTAGTALTGGGTTGAVTLNVDTTKVVTAITAGAGLTGGGTGGARTLSLDPTKVPVLQSNNTFTGTEKFNGNVGVGATPSATGYTPLTVGGTTNFGTWLALSNTSTGGHTWNIISAGSGNAEGAGNIGITDLTGKSTIWLEGNTKTTSLTATGTVGAAAVVVTSTAGAAIIDADGFGANAGGPTPGLRFGGGTSGEGIASNRTVGLTKFGMDFYTNFTARMSVLQNGQVGIGTQNPGAGLAVVSNVAGATGIYAQAANAANGSNQNGSAGVEAIGSGGDPNSSSTFGGDGIDSAGGGGSEGGGDGISANGGNGPSSDGSGASFFGGTGSANGDGLFAVAGSGLAGAFLGNVTVEGDINTGVVMVKIDHPQDPANRYLEHAAVASPDMMNLYNGNVITDTNGTAEVALPDWFESLNRDFRYQLTVLGQFAQAIVAREISGNSFTIKTDKPNVKVSWQVTGVRQDAYANAHRFAVEQNKNATERGHYIYPELFGAPDTARIAFTRHPRAMKTLQQIRTKNAAHANTASSPANSVISESR
jgi:trimeric autotransporter adhesin